MAKQSLLRTLFVLAVLLYGAAAKTDVGLAQTPSQSQSSNQAQPPCASITDAQLVAAIQEKIKADKRFDDQWAHINVSSRNRVVTLRGWVKGSAQALDLIRYAQKTRCVRRVIHIHLRAFRSNLGCLPGQRRCGDLCIDKNEDCNLIQ